MSGDPTMLPRLAAARYFASMGPFAVEWDARCPHGAEGAWMATRGAGTATVTDCSCSCEEAA